MCTRWGVQNGDAKMATNIENNANRRLAPGTQVVSKADAEPGRIARVCTYRRNGTDAWSYVVRTTSGIEVWEAGELFVPQAN